MKKILTLIASIVMIFTMASFSYADESDIMLISANPNADEKSVEVIAEISNEIRVQNDGKYISFDDVNPQIINGRTMVPFRKIFNSLGVTEEDINWISETRTVIAKKDNLEIELQIDNNIAKKTVSGETTEIKLDSAPVIVEGRTLVPVRFIAESMEKQVGWDADNRVVVIIDENKLNEELRNAIPKYFEVVELQTTPLNTFKGKADVKGILKYTDKDDKTNNSTINVKGTIDIQKNEEALFVDIKLSLTGKGELYDAVKKAELTEIDIAVIINGDIAYVKSSLLESQTNGKWLAEEGSTYKNLIEKLNMTYANPSKSKLIAIDDSKLTASSYASSKLSIELLKVLMNDKNITISGKNPAKYTVKFDLLDLFDYMNDLGAGIKTDAFKNMEMTISGKVKDGVATNNNIGLAVEIKADNETLTIELDASTTIDSYNKKVNIKVPSENEIIIQ